MLQEIVASSVQPVPRMRRAKPLRSRAKLHLPRGILDAEVERVSALGISVFVYEKVAEGQAGTVRLNFFFDGAMRQISAAAEVVSCSLSGMNGFRLALRFTDVDAQSAQALDALLR